MGLARQGEQLNYNKIEDSSDPMKLRWPFRDGLNQISLCILYICRSLPLGVCHLGQGS